MHADADAADPKLSKQHAALRSDLAAALAAFDRAQDWADLIHDLQRVNRVFTKHSSTSYLPEKHLLAKRLAQCLTSSLPSGVHLKALETYRLVFSRIGPQRLALDLPYYAGGLFPLYSYSATSLKPALLSLYESQLLPLGPALAPLLDGFVLAILPGLEDESSEFYERSVALLDAVAAAVDRPPLFCRALWRALLLSPPMRLPAATYIRARLTSDRKLPWTPHLLEDMPLVSHAIAAALNDRNALVQRAVLDLLLDELALNLPFFAQTGEDCRVAAVALVSGVFGALLRRDLSLTKRVHSWFLGGEEGNRGIRFCAKYSRGWLLGAVDDEMMRAKTLSRKESASASLVTRPCKIVVGLLDRAEISSCIAAPVSLKILQFGRDMLQSPVAPFRREVQHAVADVIETIGSLVTFGELERFVEESLSAQANSETPSKLDEERERDKYDLLSFALLLVPMDDAKVRCLQLPALLRVAVAALNRVSSMPKVLKPAVSFCRAAVNAMDPGSMMSSDSRDIQATMREIGAGFTSFFVAWVATTVRPAPSEMRRAYADISVDEEVSAEFETSAMAREDDECVVVAKAACSFLTSLIRSGVCGLESAQGAMQAAAKCASSGDVRIALPGTRAYAEIAAYIGGDELKQNMEDQSLGVIRHAWRLLHPSLATATASTAQVWLLLQRQFPNLIGIVVADGILSPLGARRLRNLERFACLWRLSVEHRLSPCPADGGLFLVLDALDDRDWGPKMLARSWLADALATDAGAVLDAPLRLLLTSEASTRGSDHEFAGVYDAPRALYAFQVLRSVVESAMFGAGGASHGARSEGDDDDCLDRGIKQPGSAVGGAETSPDRTLSAGARSLSSTSPSARTLAALNAFVGVSSQRVSSRERSVELEEGPVKLSGLLPALDYVTVLTVSALGYLRGRVPTMHHAIENHPFRSVINGGVTSENGSESLREDSDQKAFDGVDDDDMEWISAGLGFRSFSELHNAVAVAAAEFLAKLMTSIPALAPTSDHLAERSGDAILQLMARSVSSRDAVLQMHYLEAVEAIIVSEGHAFPGARLSHRRVVTAGYASLNPAPKVLTVPSEKPPAAPKLNRRHRSGHVEGNPLFLPWILAGLSQACKPPSDGRDIGSQEILALRRRWIRFVSSVLKHLSSSFTKFAEGVLLTFCSLLEERDMYIEGSTTASSALVESEFSRVDERLLLLRGLASICETIAIVFEYARRNGQLQDGGEALRKQTTQTTTEYSDSGREPAKNVSVPPQKQTASIPSTGTSVSAAQSMPGLSTSGPDARRYSHGFGARASSASTTTQYPVTSSVTSVSTVQPSAAATATMSMMNAINNPLRLLNDFVKDVFTGSASDGMVVGLDPRRGAARILFIHMPLIVQTVLQTWGPQLESQSLDGDPLSQERDRRSRSRFVSDLALPRLSRELPRERRKSQRQAVLSVFEPIFAFRPCDVVAGILTRFVGAESDAPSPHGKLCESAVDMIRSMDISGADIVVTCIAEIVMQAMKWDKASPQAEDGRLQAKRTFAVSSAISRLVREGAGDSLKDLGLLCGTAVESISGTPLPGGVLGDLESVVPLGSTPMTGSNTRYGPSKLFHAGDYFARHSPGDTETAAILFLEQYIESCRYGDELERAWPSFVGIMKDVYAGHTRKRTIPLLCRALAAYAARFPQPHPDKRLRKELMSISVSVLGLCSAMAAGMHDITSEAARSEHVNDVRAVFSLHALRALSTSMPVLLDSSFVDDRAQLNSTAGTAFAAGISVLKRTAAKAASTKSVAGMNSGTPARSVGHSEAHESTDTLAAAAAADLVLQVAKREWGVKLARRELVGLLDDPNFFCGKYGESLGKLASVVREVMGSGGSSALLASIGSGTPVSATGIPGLFTGRDSESVLRARAVRRVAFCVFVAEPDSYLPQLPSVLERLRDSLRLADPGLVIECLLCLRVLLLQTGPASIAAFRATTLSEMFRVGTEPTKNLPETLATLQFLDLITLVSPADFGYVRCFFFSNEDKRRSDEHMSTSEVDCRFEPLIPKLSVLRTKGDPLDGEWSSSSLRVVAGQTVFSGSLDSALSETFIGKYAEYLAVRNELPSMANAVPDFDLIRRELEREFVQ